MDLPINLTTQGVQIDDSYRLPFVLKLVVGRGNAIKIITINKLSVSLMNNSEVMYDIEELKDLKIFLVSDENVDLKIIWNKVTEFDVEEQQFEVLLTNNESSSALYENTSESQDESYPWRCGKYHFECVYNDKTYLGIFRIVPKNISEKQFEQVHEVINRNLIGLTEDYISYKKTFGDLNDFQQQSYWRFFDWYKKNEQLYLRCLAKIEKNNRSDLKKTYKVETVLRHVDQKSIRWEHSSKGVVYKGSKFLNRNLLEHWDTNENRIVKYRVMLLLRQMNLFIITFKNTYKDIEKRIQNLNNDIQDIKDRIVMMKGKKTTDESIESHRHLIIDLENRKKKEQKVKDNSKKLEMRFEKYKARLSGQMELEFWRSVRNTPPIKGYIAKEMWHMILNRLWNESLLLFNENEKDKNIMLPVYKPTYTLYEYYVFFSVIEILNELLFEEEEQSLTGQLVDNFPLNGLSEGTKVNLYNGNKMISVVYEEYIQPNDSLALQKGTHFYTQSNHKKPDIRIDLYEIDGLKMSYNSSIILEVKYSPLYNIWNPPGRGDTKAMEQMDGYRSIAYIRKDGDYDHRPINSVICVYPGAKNIDIMFATSYGHMLQFFPNEHDTVGKDNLKDVFKINFKLH